MRKKQIRWAITCFFICFSTIAITVSFFLFMNGRETRTSNGDNITKMDSLYCISEKPKNPFFSYKGTNAKHIVKYIFNSSEKIDGISYTYYNNFSSSESAIQAEAQLHVDYNTYMGKTSVYQEDLFPSFNINDSSLTINLYIKPEMLTSETNLFVFLGQEEYGEIKELTLEELKELYEDKHFSCKINS